MSYFTYKKRKTTLKSILVIFGLTTFAFALMANSAYADPEKKGEDTTEQVEDAVKDELAPPADVMELPKPEDKVDAPIATTPPTAPEVAVEEPTVKLPAEFTAPPADATMPGANMPPLDKAQSCFKQESGTFECICEGDKDCAELTNSEVCETGTSWRNDKGFGGCTKKTE